MAMNGDLSSIGVGDLLQMLHLGGKSGSLVLTRPLEQVVLVLQRGLLSSIHAPRGDRLSIPWTLELEGAVGAEKSALLFWTIRSEAGRLDLAQAYAARSPEFRKKELIRRHISRLLVELVAWRSGQFELIPGTSLVNPLVLDPPEGPMPWWLSALQRWEEADSVAQECRQRAILFTRSMGDGSEARISPRAQRLLGLLEQPANIDEVFDLCHHARPEALEAVRELLHARLVIPTAAGETTELRRHFWTMEAPELIFDLGHLKLPECQRGSFPGDNQPAVHSGTRPGLSAAPPARSSSPSEKLASVAADENDSQSPTATDSSAEHQPAPLPLNAMAADPNLERQLTLLTQGLDELIPQLSFYEKTKRFLGFVAFALVICLLALGLLAHALGWSRPLFHFLQTYWSN